MTRAAPAAFLFARWRAAPATPLAHLRRAALTRLRACRRRGRGHLALCLLLQCTRLPRFLLLAHRLFALRALRLLLRKALLRSLLLADCVFALQLQLCGMTLLLLLAQGL